MYRPLSLLFIEEFIEQNIPPSFPVVPLQIQLYNIDVLRFNAALFSKMIVLI